MDSGEDIKISEMRDFSMDMDAFALFAQGYDNGASAEQFPSTEQIQNDVINASVNENVNKKMQSYPQHNGTVVTSEQPSKQSMNSFASEPSAQLKPDAPQSKPASVSSRSEHDNSVCNNTSAHNKSNDSAKYGDIPEVYVSPSEDINALNNKYFAFIKRILHMVQLLQRERGEVLITNKLIDSALELGSKLKHCENARTFEQFRNEMQSSSCNAATVLYCIELLYRHQVLMEKEYISIYKDGMDIDEYINSFIYK